jgi:hypothetical protein
MFERLKKAFSRESADRQDPPSSQLTHGPVSEWAASRGMSFSNEPTGSGVTMQGKVGGRPWRMEIGKPSRNYITGEELRARAELGISDDVAAMVINRPLKDSLERKAYSMITDTLQTTADPNLPEEMRWLAMYDEVGWDSLPENFWRRYAILTDKREHALAWLDQDLARLLMEWPQPGPPPETPFIVVIMRGKCYLRMEYKPADTSTLQHASTIFTSACESALGAFGGMR